MHNLQALTNYYIVFNGKHLLDISSNTTLPITPAPCSPTSVYTEMQRSNSKLKTVFWDDSDVPTILSSFRCVRH